MGDLRAGAGGSDVAQPTGKRIARHSAEQVTDQPYVGRRVAAAPGRRRAEPGSEPPPSSFLPGLPAPGRRALRVVEEVPVAVTTLVEAPVEVVAPVTAPVIEPVIAPVVEPVAEPTPAVAGEPQPPIEATTLAGNLPQSSAPLIRAAFAETGPMSEAYAAISSGLFTLGGLAVRMARSLRAGSARW